MYFIFVKPASKLGLLEYYRMSPRYSGLENNGFYARMYENREYAGW